MAAGILRKKFREMNMPAIIDSAGLEPHLIGEPVDSVTLEFTRQRGIDLSQHMVRLFGPADFDDFDRIYVMDYNGYRDIMLYARDDQDKKKVDYVMNILMPGTKQPIPHIADMEPKYVAEAYTLFEKVSEQIIKTLKPQK